MISGEQAGRRRLEENRRAVEDAENDPDPWVVDSDPWADPGPWAIEPDRLITQLDKSWITESPTSSTSTLAPSSNQGSVMQHTDITATETNLFTLGLGPVTKPLSSITNSTSAAIQPASLPPRLQVLLDDLMSKCHPASTLLSHRFTIPYGGTAKRMNTTKKSIPLGELVTLPTPSPGQSKRKAIAMDCEMVTLSGGRSELAFLTALDFLTGEILIDHYVQPRGEVVNWNTSYSGVTRRAMAEAMRTGKGLQWEEARDRLRSIADSDTVLIGHALQNDLNVLRFIHLRIVDSSILTCDAVFPELPAEKPAPRTWNLKFLTQELLQYSIQNSKSGHSSLEDSRATRDLVMLFLEDPHKVRQWGIKTRQAWDTLRAEEVREQEEASRRRQEEVAKLKAE
ncbi:hypothetical protein N7507_009328 [Penicillium longicatenatum]|nr:hypothetical protein N7507_009328 [Penicillium longicatenatum]